MQKLIKMVTIPSFPNYKVTADGNVYSMNRKKFIVLSSCRGYPTAFLWKYGKSHTKTVHRLVALAFLPNPLNRPQVNHIDYNKSNNHVDNLEWVTPSENLIHSYKNGHKRMRGELSGVAKYTDTYIEEIKELLQTKRNIDVVREMNIPESTVAHIKRGSRRNNEKKRSKNA